MFALQVATSFTQDHGQVMCDLALGSWLIGDYRGEAPRHSRIAGQLDYLKSIYEVRRKDLWRALLERSGSETRTARRSPEQLWWQTPPERPVAHLGSRSL